MGITNPKAGESAETSSAEQSIYVIRDGRNEGPFSHTAITMQIEAGLLSDKDFGWKPGLAEWKPIRELVSFPAPTSASKFSLTILRIWRKTLSFLVWILKPLSWLTPKYWFFKHHNEECLVLATKLLPSSYDPVGEELHVRARIIDTSGSANNDLPINTNIFANIVGRLDGAVSERRMLAIGTAEMGVYFSHDVASGFAAIDKNLFEGVSHLHGDQINTLSDLSKTLSEYKHSLMGGLTDPGSLVTVQGHVGESVVAQHLESAGLKVDWANTSNNPEWDFSVDGHHLDVKAAVKDVWSSTISSHFADSGVPVVVAGDALHIPSDALHFNSETGTGFDSLVKALEHGGHHQIFVDDALSAASLHEHVQHGTSAAMGSPDVVHHHFPLVTIAFSGYKEMSLLFSDKTDFETALKHVSLDAAGTGIGGLAGAKAGALFGSILGPIGAGFGAIVGGIGGAIAARSVTNDIKKEDYESAKRAYESATHKLRTELLVEENYADNELTALRDNCQNELRIEAQQINETLSTRTSELVQWAENSRFVKCSEGLVLVKNALKQIDLLRQSLKQQYRDHGIWRRWIWPDLSSMAEETALHFLQRLSKQLIELKLRLTIEESIPRSEVFSALGLAGVVRSEVTSYLDSIYAVQAVRQKQMQTDFQRQMSMLLEKRAQAVSMLNKAIETLAEQMRNKLAPLIEAREKKQNAVKCEAKKLGYSV